MLTCDVTYNISMEPHHHHHPGHAHPPATVSPSILRLSRWSGSRGRGVDRGAVGRSLVGFGVMSAALAFTM
jgi:hypothetical protein